MFFFRTDSLAYQLIPIPMEDVSVSELIHYKCLRARRGLAC